MPALNPALRSGTFASLPPYFSPQPNQHAKTPAEYLGLSTTHERSSELDIPIFHLEPEGSDGKGMIASPQASPTTLHPWTELDPKVTLKPLQQRRETINEVDFSPTGHGIFSAMSESSSAASRVSTSPTTSSPRSSMTETTTSTSRRDSIFAPESAVVETAMENLSGVQISYYKAKSRISYHVSTIESFRNKHTGRRYIIISPPISSNIKLYFGTFNDCFHGRPLTIFSSSTSNGAHHSSQRTSSSLRFYHQTQSQIHRVVPFAISKDITRAPPFRRFHSPVSFPHSRVLGCQYLRLQSGLSRLHNQ